MKKSMKSVLKCPLLPASRVFNTLLIKMYAPIFICKCSKNTQILLFKICERCPKNFHMDKICL